MNTHFRTLLLLGFTALAVSSSGCIIETTTDAKPSCQEDQYFNVTWEVDQGPSAISLFCGETPPSHVTLVTNSNAELAVGAACQDGALCTDGVTICNWAGSTNGNIPVGTAVTLAKLISNVDGSLLSSAVAVQVPIAACRPVELSFLFNIN